MVYPTIYKETPGVPQGYLISSKRVTGGFGFVLHVVALKIGPCSDYQLKQNNILRKASKKKKRKKKRKASNSLMLLKKELFIL